MTKDEIFKEFNQQATLKRDSLNKADCPEGYAFEEYNEGWRSAFMYATDILAEIIANDQPSLPSNLDEAAEKYADNTWLLGDNWTDAARRTFKAGAQWQTGQGVISTDSSIDELPVELYNKCVEAGMTSEDKVIIQVRKK